MYEKENLPFNSQKNKNIENENIKNETIEQTSNNKTTCRKKEKFRRRLKSLESTFLLTIEEILQSDNYLSQDMINIYKEFELIEKTFEGKCCEKSACFTPCSGINKDNFSENINICFDVNEFYMQVKNGRIILLVNRLRCEILEFEIDIPELIDEDDLQKQVSSKVNQIINLLSQIICKALGGNQCLRKN